MTGGNIAIEVGDKLPEFTFRTAKIEGKGSSCPSPNEIKVDNVFDNKTVVLIGVPGAFTPTCSNNHIPGFIAALESLKAKGVDTVAITSVNDPFVMAYWAENLGIPNDILMLADGNGAFTKLIGMENDLSGVAMGLRSKRYAMIVKNRIVKYIGVDSKQLEKSSAESILSYLGK